MSAGKGRATSWGRYFHYEHDVISLEPLPEALPAPQSPERTLLAYGCGRSYGDVCLNGNGTLLKTSRLNHFLGFDRENGVLRCESGATLAEILDLIVGVGWFLPVSPGTQFVTIGGAVANDIHGKNHHVAGTLGRHVRKLGLLRSDGRHYECSLEENTDLFRATIAGLGLTGLITWVEMQLLPVKGPLILQETLKFERFGEFLEIAADSDGRFDYTAAWLDTIIGQGRGVFFRGNHHHESRKVKGHGPLATVPQVAPNWLLNGVSMRAFNYAYYLAHSAAKRQKLVHYQPFFYPLDRVLHWNRLYGRRGFFQYQFVLPSVEKFDQVLALILSGRELGFLAVLKKFGDLPSPGLLSFPRPGFNLSLDFPNRGDRTLRFLSELDQLVCRLGGRAYPAKDSVMTKETFASYYPEWREFARFRDPLFSSSFARRVSDE